MYGVGEWLRMARSILESDESFYLKGRNGG